MVFKSDCDYFCSRFFKDGFKHVFAIERQALGWVCVDASRYDLFHVVLPASYHDDVMSSFIRLNEDATVMKLEVCRGTTTNIYPRFGMVSCVGIIQYALGVYWPWIITPYQLYCRLESLNNSHIKVINIYGREQIGKTSSQCCG